MFVLPFRRKIPCLNFLYAISAAINAASISKVPEPHIRSTSGPPAPAKTWGEQSVPLGMFYHVPPAKRRSRRFSWSCAGHTHSSTVGYTHLAIDTA